MIVVSDTSPIANLIQIGMLDLLHEVFGEVIIPPTVHQEILGLSSFNVDLHAYLAAKWILVKSPALGQNFKDLLGNLDEGESEAITLAQEIHADWLLIDERMGTKMAEELGLHPIGLVGVLIKAKEKGLIKHVIPILYDLRGRAGFWLGDSLINRIKKAINE